MFERYPSSSVRALMVARDTAVAIGSPLIEREHLLAGAVEAWPVAGSHRPEILRKLGFPALSGPPPPINPDLQFSPLAERLLNKAMSQADHLGHHRIQPEHLLLALFDEPNCEASAILREVGIERDLLVTSAAREASADDRPLAYRAQLEVTGRPLIRTIKNGAV